MKKSSEDQIVQRLSVDAQKCVNYIKENSHNATSLDLIKLCDGDWESINKELRSIANRSEVLDSVDEPNRNKAGRILRVSSKNTWSYDPV